MLKVLKFRHITMFGRDLDEILVDDDSIPLNECACDLCIFNDSPTTECALIHDCGTCENTYWLIGACTAYPDGAANPFGRGVAP